MGRRSKTITISTRELPTDGGVVLVQRINPESDDCLEGMLKGGHPIDDGFRWNLAGTVRDAPERFNLLRSIPVIDRFLDEAARLRRTL